MVGRYDKKWIKRDRERHISIRTFGIIRDSSVLLDALNLTTEICNSCIPAQLSKKHFKGHIHNQVNPTGNGYI
jgi:hypothetical protein